MVKSNMLNWMPISCWRKFEMMTLGGVPIRVVMPPRRDANARGMRKSDAGCLPLLDTLTATGMRRLTAPMLFMNAERNADRPESEPIRRLAYSGMREIQPAIESTMPEFCSARLSTRTAATVTTAGCPKPW